MPESKKRRKPSDARPSRPAPPAPRRVDTPPTRNGASDKAALPSTTTDTVAPALVTPAPRKQMRPVVRRALFITGGMLGLIILSIAGYLFWIVQRGQPTTNGTAQVPGLGANVTVVRDSSGIPHITAATQHDLYMAQGYVHAQDRLFQMDFTRRLASGRLSEVLGTSTVGADTFYRTLGLRRDAEASLASLPKEVRDALEAYAAGVNAFIDSHHDALPLEYNLLGNVPEHWTPTDTLTYSKFMAWYLANGNLSHELVMADLLQAVGPEKTAQLMPAYPADQPTIVQGSALPGNPAGSVGAALVPGLLHPGGEAVGSNNWVVDGTRTASGKPLLANDPHLGVQNPSFWYINHLRLADGSFEVAGTSFAGAPGVVIGHNKDISWGVTNLGPDTQDLFVETLDPAAHPGQYEYQEAWQPLTLLTDTIRVKEGPSVTMTITSTVHGPLINAMVPTLTKPTTLQWAATGRGTLLIAIIHLQTARDWTGFRAALADWDAPGQNFVYADTTGNIGYQATGKIPIRKAGTGAAPVDGATGANDWTGFIPFAELPTVYNPPNHQIVTANNRVIGDQYPHLITTFWQPGDRAARIGELLKATEKLGVEDYKRIQNDTTSIYAKSVISYYAALKSDDPKLGPIIAGLGKWDGNVAGDSAPAALYEVAVSHLLSTTTTSALGGTIAGEYLSNAPGQSSFFLAAILKDKDAPWWDDPTTTEHEGRDAALLRSVQAAVDELGKSSGDDPNGWLWNKLHQIYFGHALGIPPLDGVFSLGPYGTGGDGTTVDTGYYDPTLGYYQVFHPSTRQITEVGNWDTMQIIIAPGQSGQPFNKHWGDMIPDWLAGRYRPLHVEPNSIAADAQGTLTLQP